MSLASTLYFFWKVLKKLESYGPSIAIYEFAKPKKKLKAATVATGRPSVCEYVWIMCVGVLTRCRTTNNLRRHRFKKFKLNRHNI